MHGFDPREILHIFNVLIFVGCLGVMAYRRQHVIWVAIINGYFLMSYDLMRVFEFHGQHLRLVMDALVSLAKDVSTITKILSQ